MLNEFQSYLSSLSGANEINKIDDNTILFKYKGLNFLFTTEKDDPYYIRLILPKIATTETLKEGENIYTIMNEYNKKYKAVKVSLWEDESVWLSIEQFLYSKDNANELFKRAISLLESVSTEFVDNIKK